MTPAKRTNLLLILGLPVSTLVGIGLGVFVYSVTGSAGSPEKALAKGLDAWIFGDHGLQTKEGVSFYDDDRVLTHSKLMKYEVTNSRSVDKGKTEFSVILVLESRGHTEIRRRKKYSVYQLNGKWKIAQADPRLSEWLDSIRVDSKEGQDQEEGRKAARELASGKWSRRGDDALQAFKEFELRQRIAFGESEALRKQFRLMQRKQEELDEYLAKEDDPEIRGILLQIVTGIEELASAEKGLK